MKKLIVAIAGVLVIVAAVVWWRGGASAVNTLLPQESRKVAVTTASINEDAEYYSIQAEYPQFGIPALDGEIRGAVEVAVAGLKAQPANPSPHGIKNEFSSTFDSVYIGPDIVSVRLLLSQYTGGAHGLSVAVGVNYDRANKKLLTLDDALALTGKTLEQVSASALAQLNERYSEVQFPDGAAPAPENYAAFTVDAENVTFTFQQYQVEAYALGMPQVVIPRVR